MNAAAAQCSFHVEPLWLLNITLRTRNVTTYRQFFTDLTPPSCPSIKPHLYQTGLEVQSLPLCPYCLAADRLKLWHSFISQVSVLYPDSSFHITLIIDLEWMLSVMAAAWVPGTRETYGAGLLVFHIFYDSQDIPESQQCPVNNTPLHTFITTCAGSYSGSALANYVFGIRSWHTLHRVPWLIFKVDISAALDGAAALTPPSKFPKRLPFTPDLLIQIRSHLDLASPLDVAIFACITTTF